MKKRKYRDFDMNKRIDRVYVPLGRNLSHVLWKNVEGYDTETFEYLPEGCGAVYSFHIIVSDFLDELESEHE